MQWKRQRKGKTRMKKNEYIKFASPDLSRKERKAIQKVLDSGWLTNGPVVRQFENRVAYMSNCSRAVAFDSCTAAMEMTLRALGIGPGDEVITTPYTYTATAEVIRNTGAKIVFVDLAPKSFEMNYRLVEEAITEKTKAVIPVDIGGKLCDYTTLISVLKARADIFNPSNDVQAAIGRVAVVADAAHSFGAEMYDRLSGEFADFTCFSFHVLKCITTGGEGGAVVWNDIAGIDNGNLERKLRLLGDHGQTSRDKTTGWEYDIALFGYNHIMTNVDAAMGMAQLDRYDEIFDKRMDVTLRYDKLFSEAIFAKPMIQHFGSYYTSAMHLYPISLEAPAYMTEQDKGHETWRNMMFRKLSEAGVPCNVHYKPLPMMTAYKDAGYNINDYPNAYRQFRSLLTIPYHTGLTAKDQEYIVETIERLAISL